MGHRSVELPVFQRHQIAGCLSLVTTIGCFSRSSLLGALLWPFLIKILLGVIAYVVNCIYEFHVDTCKYL